MFEKVGASWRLRGSAGKDMTGQDTSEADGRARSTTLVAPISAARDNTITRVMYCEESFLLATGKYHR
jgi:hypothetical protein